MIAPRGGSMYVAQCNLCANSGLLLTSRLQPSSLEIQEAHVQALS